MTDTWTPPTDPKAEMLKTLTLYPRVTQCLTALYTGPMCIETIPGHFLLSLNYSPSLGRKEEQGINLKWYVWRRTWRNSIRVLKPTAHTPPLLYL